MKQNRLNGLVAAYIHKDLDINPDEILKLYRQMNYRGFDFDVWIWNINVINRDIKNRLTTRALQPAEYSAPDPTRSMGPDMIRRVGSGTNIIAYPDPDWQLVTSENFENFYFVELTYLTKENRECKF